MKKVTAKSVVSSACTLGEGPVWFEGALWWVDINEMKLHRWQPGPDTVDTRQLPERIGFAVPAADGTWRVGLESGIHTFAPDSGGLRRLCDPEPDRPDNRFNDGKCDPEGRLWGGTMSTVGEKETGALYRFSGNAFERIIAPVSISNGLAWNPETDMFYYNDTPTREVAAFDYNPASGDIANRRVAWQVPEKEGSPDGMTIDTDGNLWVALWGGHGVVCVDPLSGSLLGKVDVPAPNVTSCAFGGDALDTLYITTARAGMSAEHLQACPQAGNVFAARPGVRGWPVDCAV